MTETTLEFTQRLLLDEMAARGEADAAVKNLQIECEVWRVKCEALERMALELKSVIEGAYEP